MCLLVFAHSVFLRPTYGKCSDNALISGETKILYCILPKNHIGIVSR
jgi:hypothetical protein